MTFSFQKPQTVYVSSGDYFAADQRALPGVTVYAQEEKAKSRSIQREGMAAGKQWYAVEIPGLDTFLHRTKPMSEQPFSILHSLLSQKSLSLLFTDELEIFHWQLSCYLKDKAPEESETLSHEETAVFFHEKRNVLLSLPSGDALISFVMGKARNEPKILPAYFSALGIAGIVDEADENTTFLVFNPRASIKILSIRRESYAYPAVEG